jgi:hypothetical protein
MPVSASSAAFGCVNSAGQKQKPPVHLSLNRFLRVGFRGSKVTFHGGLILVRELDQLLGFGGLFVKRPSEID